MENLTVWLLYAFLGSAFGLMPVGLISLRLAHLADAQLVPNRLMPHTLCHMGEKKSALIVATAQLAYSLLALSLFSPLAYAVGFLAASQVRQPRPLHTQLNLIPLLAFTVGQTALAAWVGFAFLLLFLQKPERFNTLALCFMMLSPVLIALTSSPAASLIALALSLLILAIHKQELLLPHDTFR